MSQATYNEAGVNREAGEQIKDSIKELARSTHTGAVLKEIGLFSGFYALDLQRFHRPVLVSSIDGVGTKVKIAQTMGVYDTIGEDLVNHCVNDIMVCGAEPLFFMDYLAADKLDPGVVTAIVKGISQACKESECALIGGETAEMPGVYAANNFDVAGCIVGLVDLERIIDGSGIKPGDQLLGVHSNGLHTNGYSLVRRVFFEIQKCQVTDYLEETQSTLGEELLRTHRSYKDLLNAIKETPGVHGIAHITGGGIVDNTARLIKNGLQLAVDWAAWEIPPIFQIVKKAGNISDSEMRNVFNLGIGLVLIVSPKSIDYALDACMAAQQEVSLIGSVSAK